MTGADFALERERLGLSISGYAAVAKTAGRTVRRWEAGASDVPGAAVALLGAYRDGWRPGESFAGAEAGGCLAKTIALRNGSRITFSGQAITLPIEVTEKVLGMAVDAFASYHSYSSDGPGAAALEIVSRVVAEAKASHGIEGKVVG